MSAAAPPAGNRWEDLAIDALAASTDLLVAADAGLVIRFASQGVKDILGYEPEEAVGRNGLDFFHPGDVPLFAKVAAAASTGYVPQNSILYRLRHRDGSYVTLDLAGGPLFEGPASDARPRGFWLVGRRPDRSEVYAEVLHRLLADEPLTEALENMGTALLPDVGRKFCITLWLPGHPVTTVGQPIPDILTGREPLPGSPWSEALRAGLPFTSTDLSELDRRVADAARSEGLAGLTIVPVTGLDGTTQATITLWTQEGIPLADASANVLDRIKDLVEAAIGLRQQIEHLQNTAARDALTGLANRRAFGDALEATDAQVESAVLYLDLDQFKQVNDTYGHATGDELLRIVARRIQSAARNYDVVARIGGDEFAVLCRECDTQKAQRFAARILQILRDPIVIDGLPLHVSGSIGIATAVGVDGETVRQADAALYEAKRAGRDTVRTA